MNEQGTMLVDETIREFQGEYRFLSMFAPVALSLAGPWWDPSVLEVQPTTGEHWYHIAKVEPGTPHAVEHMNAIAHARVPGEAKRLGQRKVFEERGVTLRRGWDRGVKVVVMLAVNRAKFAPTAPRGLGTASALDRLLMATSPRVLIEGNDWGDDYWGVLERGHGRGKNMLGRLLMLVRAELLVAAASGVRVEELRG
jgi:ribA/ribD-fused uncharacterized protein